MKELTYLICVILFTSCIQYTRTDNQSTSSKDSNSDIYNSGDQFLNGKENAIDIAMGVYEFLKNADTAKYLELAVPLEAQKYIMIQNFEYRPDITDSVDYMRYLENRYEARMENYLVRTFYLHQIMKEDYKIDIRNSKFISYTSVKYKISNPAGLGRYVVGDWEYITLEIEYEGTRYWLEVPQILKIKEKWYLYTPEYYMRDARELEFLEDHFERERKRADDFIK